MSRMLGVLAVIVSARMAAADDWHGAAKAFLTDNCLSCHSAETVSGGLDLDRLESNLGDATLLRRWVLIYDRIAKHEMPPKDAPRPDEGIAGRFLSQLSDALNRADSERRQSVLRRLNRVEYEYTIRDLFGIRVDVKEMLPADPTAQGFDTVGEALAISPEQMEVYLQAANKALDQVFGADKEPKRVAACLPLGRDTFANRLAGQIFVRTDDDSLVTFQQHWCPTVFHTGQATADGTYRVRIQAKAYQTDKPLVMAVYGGDVIVGRQPSHLVGYYDVLPGDEWTVVTFDDYLETHGCYQMKPYDLSAPTQGPERFKGPGLMIGEVEVQGPLEAWPPASRAQLLGDVDPKTAAIDEAKAIFARLLPRAFRRNVETDELQLYLTLTKSALDAGRPFIDALRVGLQAILCSPEFLLREESAAAPAPGQPALISDDALASRLSYFLWTSMPDDELMQTAQAGRLHEPEVLRGQLERLLSDEKCRRFVESFTGQWLDLRQIDATEPDMRQYPEFDEMLRYSMIEETRRFISEILEKNFPVSDFIDSDWAILNERLATHYGITGVSGQPFHRVELGPDRVRGGLLTQASVLKVTANGTNTSPVVRGAWVLKNIVGQASPPPPPGVAAIEPDIRGATTIREQLDKHRRDESCSVCHSRIDPPGFALESFDAIGGWREWYRSLGEGEPVNLEIHRRRVQYRKGRTVDPSGALPDGRSFADIRQFKQLLLADMDQLVRCLAEKLLTYSLGRELGFSDRAAVNEIVAKVRGKNNGFRTLIHEVVQSKLFRQK